MFKRLKKILFQKYRIVGIYLPRFPHSFSVIEAYKIQQRILFYWIDVGYNRQGIIGEPFFEPYYFKDGREALLFLERFKKYYFIG